MEGVCLEVRVSRRFREVEFFIFRFISIFWNFFFFVGRLGIFLVISVFVLTEDFWGLL